MKCNICKEEHSEKSGAFIKHLISKHSITSKTEYYYSFNSSDLCEFCGIRDKEVITWAFEKRSSCSDKECIKKNASLSISNAQKRLAENGLSNFQKESTKVNRNVAFAIQIANGTAYCQTEEARSCSRRICLERNTLNNPMKNVKSVEKMKKSSTGKVLSSEHREAIGKGLSKFLASLNDEEFAERMANTDRGRVYEMAMDDLPLLNLSVDDFDTYIIETARQIAEAKIYLKNNPLKNE